MCISIVVMNGVDIVRIPGIHTLNNLNRGAIRDEGNYMGLHYGSRDYPQFELSPSIRKFDTELTHSGLSAE